jgi:hypothetical protein
MESRIAPMNHFRVDDLGAMPASRLALRIAALVLASAARCAFAQSAPAEAEADEAAGAQTAAAQAQNPIAHVISVPFQNNALTRTGPYRKTADTLLIQPVIPIRIDDNWSVITRTIVPVVYLPRTSPEQGEVTGLGNIEPQFYFTPAHPGKFIWGAGAQAWLPTASQDALGVNKWGGGPAVVGLVIDGHWVAGALLNNVWAGSGKGRVNEMTLNPFANYNLAKGWYLASTPVITSNWDRPESQRWTVPVGGGFGRVFKIAGLHVNARLEAFRNVERPRYAAATDVQAQLQFLCPEH